MKQHIIFYQIKVALYREGDEAAISDVLLKIEPLLKKSVKGVAPWLSQSSALYGDLLQEGRLRVYNAMKPGKWDPNINPNFLTYAMQGVRNGMLTFLKREIRFSNEKPVSTFEDETGRTGEEVLWDSINTSQIWGWIPEPDAMCIYEELADIVMANLKGTSLTVYLLRLMGKRSAEIRQMLSMTKDELESSISFLEWFVPEIIRIVKTSTAWDEVRIELSECH